MWKGPKGTPAKRIRKNTLKDKRKGKVRVFSGRFQVLSGNFRCFQGVFSPSPLRVSPFNPSKNELSENSFQINFVSEGGFFPALPCARTNGWTARDVVSFCLNQQQGQSGTDQSSSLKALFLLRFYVLRLLLLLTPLSLSLSTVFMSLSLSISLSLCRSISSSFSSSRPEPL